MEKNKNTTTEISVINQSTTLTQWQVQSLPLATYAAISKNKNSAAVTEFGARNAFNALIAYKVTTINTCIALSSSVRNEAFKGLAIRSLYTLAKECDLAGSEGRAIALRTVFGTSLVDKLRQFSSFYLRANPQKMEEKEEKELLDICAEVIRAKYNLFSILEIEAAFNAAAEKPNIQAYGQLSVKLIHEVLAPYKHQRGVCLSFLLDKEQEESRTLSTLERIALSDEGYKDALIDFSALAMENRKHKTFHTCPHHYVQRMVDECILMFEGEEKKQAWADALAYAAYDILHEGQSPTQKKIAKAFVATLGIAPLHTGRTSSDRDDMRDAAILPFDYAGASREKFIAFAKFYYSKVLYFRGLAPYAAK
jgi:hypothetical protein